jgi:hypothetical protein
MSEKDPGHSRLVGNSLGVPGPAAAAVIRRRNRAAYAALSEDIERAVVDVRPDAKADAAEVCA